MLVPVVLALGIVVGAWGQCPVNTEPRGEATVGPLNVVVEIDSCVFAGNYSTILGLQVGMTLEFDSVRGDVATVRQGILNGTVLAFGQVPLIFTAFTTDPVFVHWNLDGCSNEPVCRRTTVTYVSGCVNTDLNPLNPVIVGPAGTPQLIADTTQMGQYAHVNGAAEGDFLEMGVSDAAAFVTVRAGSFNGPLVAYSSSPAIFEVPDSGALYVHYNGAQCAHGTALQSSTVLRTCVNSVGFGGGVIRVVGEQVNWGCSRLGEYASFSQAGAGMVLTVNGGSATRYITIRSWAGPSILTPQLAFGASPLTFRSTFSGNISAHWTEADCSTATPGCLVSSLTWNGCENVVSGGAITVDTVGQATAISNCSTYGEYASVAGVIAGKTYLVTFDPPSSPTGPFDFVTVHEGASNGAIVSYDKAPFYFTSAFTGTAFLHFTRDFCATEAACRSTAVMWTCINSVQNGNANVGAFLEAAQITGNAAFGEYSVVNGVAAGTVLTFSHAGGGFVTLRAGAGTSSQLAYGASPLTYTSEAGGSIWVHWNSAGCGSEAGQGVATVTWQCPMGAYWTGTACVACDTCGMDHFLEAPCFGNATADTKVCQACGTCAAGEFVDARCDGTQSSDVHSCTACQPCESASFSVATCSGTGTSDTAKCVSYILAAVVPAIALVLLILGIGIGCYCHRRARARRQAANATSRSDPSVPLLPHKPAPKKLYPDVPVLSSQPGGALYPPVPGSGSTRQSLQTSA